MKKITLTISFIISAFLTIAQDYFQQEVNYIINVKLNDEDHTLDSDMIIDYTNNSKEELDFIWFHIWPNAYKDNTTALAKQKLSDGDRELQNATDSERGYISELDFKVDNKKVDWKYHPEHIDICKIILNKPIKPGTSIRIQTPFKVKIPDAKFSRLGHVGQSYMITQWYPKPAVYDKDGWHEIPYLDQGEFYSEFGSFEVNITLPKNYTVGATGNLQNEDEHKRLDQIAEITWNKGWNNTFEDDMSFPESSKETKTLKYTEDNIHDFGWFADKRYHVLKGEVTLPHSGREVTLYTMFTNNESHLWKESIEYMHDGVYYYSLWNGDYPYNYCTAVDGTIAAGGGMEYPTITVIGKSGNAKALEEVIVHEIGHNWFYGILGSNERKHPWLDEGINSFYELRYMRAKYPNFNMVLDLLPKGLLNTFDLNGYTNKQIVGELGYMINAWRAQDQPIELRSEDYTPINYGGIVYMKSAIVFDYLMSYLGEEEFDACMKSYYEKWKFKHPQPSDLEEIFKEKIDEDLSWFFSNMITTTNQLDYAITSIKKDNHNLHITLKNKGDISGPLVIHGIRNGKAYNETWIDGFEDSKQILYPNEMYDKIYLDYHAVMPETNRNNNIYKTNGVFKKCEPIKLQILGSLYNRERTQIFFLPSLHWNKYNETSLGISLYNQFIPKGGLSYKISPMYSIRSKDLVGNAKISFNTYSHSSIFSHSNFNFELEKYLYDNNKHYIRYSPSLRLSLNKDNLRDKRNHQIISSYIYLDTKEEKIGFTNIGYSFSNSRTINPYSLYFNFETSEYFSKASIIINTTINNNRLINIRGFLGRGININNDRYNLKMTAWNGIDDYSFSNKTLARSEESGTYSKQIFITEGGLKHNTDIESSSWLASINTTYKLENIPMTSLYAEAGTNLESIAYGTGIEINPTKNLTIYLPIYTENKLFNGVELESAIRININLDLKIQDIINLEL